MVHSSSIGQYIDRYGRRGWLAGLADERDFASLLQPPGLIQTRQEGEDPIRVMDCFAAVWLNLHQDVRNFGLRQSRQERDAVINAIKANVHPR